MSKRSRKRPDVVDRKLLELDVEPLDLGGEARLGEIIGVEVDADHPRGAAALHLQRIEAAVAADVEHGLASEIAAAAHRRSGAI